MKNSIDQNFMSAPANPDNPTFDSLLSALKDVYEGNADMELLEIYHKELTGQLNYSRFFIQNMEDSDITKEIRDMSLGSLTIAFSMMSAIRTYIDNPSPQTMGEAVSAFLDARAAIEYVHQLLDEKIEEGKKE